MTVFEWFAAGACFFNFFFWTYESWRHDGYTGIQDAALAFAFVVLTYCILVISRKADKEEKKP